MAAVSDEEFLLLWRALQRFRSGTRPACQPRGRPPSSACPLAAECPRWPERLRDDLLALEETADQTEQRRARWPCSRLLELLGPTASRIS